MNKETNSHSNTIRSDSDITLFARTNYRGSCQVFGIRRSDRRYHTFLIGKTGMGKSTLIENFILSDLENDEGVILFDPHGDLVEKLLRSTPKHRLSDLIYFNPADTSSPLGFNILEKQAGSQTHLVASGLVSVFKKLWQDSWGPRLEHILRSSVLTLLEFEGMTLLDLPKLLTDKDFRTAIVALLENQQLKDFWEKEFENYSPHFRGEAV
ncbi:MAG: hypothetical protein FD167_5659, partial [bacterium]